MNTAWNMVRVDKINVGSIIWKLLNITDPKKGGDSTEVILSMSLLLKRA